MRQFINEIAVMDLHTIKTSIGPLFVAFWALYFLMGPEAVVSDLFSSALDAIEEFLVYGVIIVAFVANLVQWIFRNRDILNNNRAP